MPLPTELTPVCTKGNGRCLDELLLEPAFKLFSLTVFLLNVLLQSKGTRVIYIHASPVDTVVETGVSHVYTSFVSL